MPPSSSLPAPVLPRPQQKRPSERQVLKGALDRRDQGAVAWLSLRWVHRHGVEALPSLMQELTAGDASLKDWWHDHLHATAAPGAAPGRAPVDAGEAAAAAAGEVAASAAEQAVAEPELVAQGFSFAAITLEAVQLEIEGPLPELVLSFDQAAAPEPEISLEETFGAETAASLAATEEAGPPISIEAAAPADPAAGPSAIAEEPVEFLAEPLAFDPWLEAPAAATLTAEGPAEDLPAEAPSAAAPEPEDQTLDGFVQAPLPFLELSLDPLPAVSPLIPARPSAARVFNFGAEPVDPGLEPAKPRSDEPSASAPSAAPASADPQAADAVAELATTDPPASPTASFPAEPSPHPAEAAEVAQALWRAPLARMKSLVRVCLEEVVSTFHNSHDDDSDTASTSATPSASGPAQASSSVTDSDPAAGQLPPLESELTVRPPRLSATEIAPALTPQGRTLALRERAAGALAGRPAPAPDHPGLASLRSWLPDDTSPADTRGS